ncbi:aminoacyl-tRNA hydrolase [Deltaproteobacteria bacterium]|nr:aminoacyl-tRNA hydrolase [Deltaproteobacteria bacterium]
MDLIVGLGNPGPEYKNTRHNIGFQVITCLSHELGVRLNDQRFQSRNTLAELQGKDIMLLNPSTFMNLSGTSVKACADFFNIKEGNLLIIHDDLDLPAGKIKIVQRGGSGGHRGVQSVIDHLNSTLFPRIKIGIGRPRDGETIEDYVLTQFYDDQIEVMEEAIQISAQACRLFVLYGVESAINQIN